MIRLSVAEEDGSILGVISMEPIEVNEELALPIFVTIEIPDGLLFELVSNLPIEEIKALAEMLVPAQ